MWAVVLDNAYENPFPAAGLQLQMGVLAAPIRCWLHQLGAAEIRIEICRDEEDGAKSHILLLKY